MDYNKLWDQLIHAVMNCNNCQLSRTRTHSDRVKVIAMPI